MTESTTAGIAVRCGFLTSTQRAGPGARPLPREPGRRPWAARAALMLKAERDRVLGVREVSDISPADLPARYKRHQKTRLRATTFERLDGILETLTARQPARARDISRRTVAE